jgi:hypothetical protein
LNLDRAGNVKVQEDWLVAMRAEISACKNKNFFQSAVCIDRVRWKYCTGRWNTVEECRNNQGGAPIGN